MQSLHSQRSGYRSSSSLSPTTIGAVAVVHLALGAAILSMTAMEAIQKQVDVIWARSIRAEPTKTDPVKPPPQPRTKQVPDTHVAPITPTIDLSSFDKVAIKLDPLPDPGGIAGTGPVVEGTKPPETAEPLLVGARPDARFRDGFQPPYPAAMLRMQIEGKVTVRVMIGADGRVTDVTLIDAPDPAFFEATRRQALSRWRFVPATRDGVPVASEKVMTITFRLLD